MSRIRDAYGIIYATKLAGNKSITWRWFLRLHFFVLCITAIAIADSVHGSQRVTPWPIPEVQFKRNIGFGIGYPNSGLIYRQWTKSGLGIQINVFPFYIEHSYKETTTTTLSTENVTALNIGAGIYLPVYGAKHCRINVLFSSQYVYKESDRQYAYPIRFADSTVWVDATSNSKVNGIVILFGTDLEISFWRFILDPSISLLADYTIEGYKAYPVPSISLMLRF